MNWRLIVIGFLLLSVSVCGALAAPSTNPADYFFYDDMNGGDMAASYGTLSVAAYSTTVPYPGGTKSIQVNTSPNINLDNVISSTNFTSAEYTNPYCLSYGEHDTEIPGSNLESGIIFTSWANLIVNRGSSINISFADNSNYFPFGPFAQDTWYNVTACYTDGYSAAGTTTVILFYNGVNHVNTSTALRSSLASIGLHNRMGSSGIAYFGPMRIWNYTQYGSTGPVVALNASPVLTVVVQDVVTGVGISGFCINATGTNTSQYLCNATGSTVGFNTTGTYNITVLNITSGNATAQWYNVTELNYAFSTDATVTLLTYQGTINLAAYRLYANTSIDQINATNNKRANATMTGSLTLLSSVGVQNILVNVTGNYTKNVSCTLTAALGSANCNATGIYDDLFTIGAKYSGSGLQNFTVTVTNSTLGGVLFVSNTTTGNVTIPVLQGYWYNFLINASGYALANVTIPANASTNLYNFTLYKAQTIVLTIRDELTRNILNNTNFTIEFINDQEANNYTTSNGTFYIDLVIPEDYTFRYRASEYPERDYYANVASQSVNNITLYAISFNESDDVLVTITSTSGFPIEDATVKLMRYYVYCNCYEVVEMAKTSYAGVAFFNAQYYEGHYKWSVDYNGANYFVSETPEVLVPEEGEITVTRTIIINLGSDYYSQYVDITETGYVCTYNSTSGGLSFTWSDASGLVTNGCLDAQVLSGVNYESIGENCQAAATGSVVLNTNVSKTYKYYATLTIDGEETAVCAGVLDQNAGYDFGNYGIFLAAGILITLVLAFSYSAIAVLVICAVGILAINMLGLMTFTGSFISGFAVLVIGLGVYVMRS